MDSVLIVVGCVVFTVALAAVYFTLPIWRELNHISGKIGEPDYSGLTGSSDFGLQSVHLKSLDEDEKLTDQSASDNKAA